MIDAAKLREWMPPRAPGETRALPYAAQSVTSEADEFQPAQSLESVPVASLRKMVAACGAPPVAAGEGIALEKIPFGVEVEMEGFDQNKMTAFLQGLPEWPDNGGPRRWALVHDGSLNNGKETVSPVMTLESGQAEQEIATILGHLKEYGANASANCGLHVHVSAKILGERGLTNLMRMALEQENMLYHVAQNGQRMHRGVIKDKGYRDGQPFTYAKLLGRDITDPFPVLHAAREVEFRNALYDSVPHKGSKPPAVDSSQSFRPEHRHPIRYYGVNFNSVWYRGTVEFRMFNGTDDPKQLMTDIYLVLGMMKAAADGAYAYLRPQPLEVVDPNRPVSRESLEHFLHCVSPTPAVRDDIMRSFVSGGGKVSEDPPVTDPDVLNVVGLMRSGYWFHSEGKIVTSPYEVQRELELGRRPVIAVDPQSLAQVPVADTAELAALREKAPPATAPSAELERIRQAFGVLRHRQYTLYLPVPEKQGEKQAEKDGEGKLPAVQDVLKKLLAEQKDAKAPLELPLINPQQVYFALRHGQLVVVPPGDNRRESIVVHNVDELENYVQLEEGRTDAASPTTRHILELVDRLKDSGYPLRAYEKDPQDTYVPSTRAGLLDAIVGGHVCVPLADSGRIRRLVESPAELDELVALAEGNVASMDGDTRMAAALLHELQGRGLQFTAKGQATGYLNSLGRVEAFRAGALIGHFPQKSFFSRGQAAVPDLPALTKLAARYGIQPGATHPADERAPDAAVPA